MLSHNDISSDPSGLNNATANAAQGGVFIHEKALVEPGATLGSGTRIGAFVHVLPGAVIGRHCNLDDYVLIESDVRLGDQVTVGSGVQIWSGIVLEDNVFIGPNATFANDMVPRGERRPERPRTLVQQGALIGANATVMAGLTIGRNAVVSAGSVVTRNVPPNAIVVGNPAWIKSYISPGAKGRLATSSVSGELPVLTVPGVGVHKLPLVSDMRGSLSFAEFADHLPFVPQRYFLVFDVPSEEVRGEHAHKKLHQFLICVKGSCTVMVEDGHHRDEIMLDSPDRGIHIPPMVWAIQYKYSSDAVLLVLASDVYDPDDYIRDYDEYLVAVRRG
jgi:acetyltransferase-like isoleucine patch superfamily enzyme/dTDP-4-dehydrorhamnose 3,5-epimerase-like enzyme